MPERQRATQQELEKRRQWVHQLFLLGTDTTHLIDKVQQEFGVTERQAYNYLREIKERLAAKSMEDSPVFYGLQESRFEFLFRQAMTEKNWEEGRKIVQNLTDTRIKREKTNHGHRKNQSNSQRSTLHEALELLREELENPGPEAPT